MDLNGEPRNKTLTYTVNWFLTRVLRSFKGGRIVFSIICAGKTGYPHAKEWSWTFYIIPYTKTNSKWIKDLNVKSEIIKLLRKNIGQNLHDTGFDFLDVIPKEQAIKLYVDKLDSIKKIVYKKIIPTK